MSTPDEHTHEGHCECSSAGDGGLGVEQEVLDGLEHDYLLCRVLIICRVIFACGIKEKALLWADPFCLLAEKG